MTKQKIAIPQLRKLKEQSKKFTMITAYDYPMASLIDRSNSEMILIGDSLGMVVLGYDSTVPVNMEDVIYHLRAVHRAARSTLLVADMPFGSYNSSVEDAIKNATRLLKEGADCVKLEGGLNVVDKIKGIVGAGIPVMAHIGLTPQTVSMLGGFKVQGKDHEAAKQLLADAKELEKAGAFAVLLECVPSPLAKIITESLKVPTVGTGAGPHVDGHCLNAYDLLGIFEKFKPKFVKQYSNLAGEMINVFNTFHKEIETGVFPQPEHCFGMDEEDLKRLY